MHQRWLVNRTNPEYIQYVSISASVSSVLAQILINRGLKSSCEISSFLNPDISQLSDPFDIQGMKTAVDRIIAASKRGERVLVHGDYDADGLSSTAIMLKALKMLGIDCCYFIPNRMEHGYGFNPPSVKNAEQVGANLIITVDCGITSFEAAALCRKSGIDVIITDHHEPVKVDSSKLKVKSSEKSIDQEFVCPDAIAIINPKLSTLNSQLSNLSGAGIAFKVAQALAMVHDSQFTFHDLLDLAALGTMADVVPLTGENRLIVREGLKLLKNGGRPGIEALKRAAGIIGKDLRTGLLLFSIIPRINAAGRISDATSVIKLLLTDLEDEANDIAISLNKLNSERQQIEEKVYQEALYKLKSQGIRSVIVLASEGWHKGVVGIVASRIAEEFYRPAFVLSIEGNIARGSARSIPSFDLYRALSDCKELLKGFGGHKQAAGLELDSQGISCFEDRINSIADQALSEKDFVPALEIDADIDFSEINFNLTKDFAMLEPFGFGNPEPLLGSKGLEIVYPRILKDTHLKMKLKQNNQSIDAIGFNMASFFENLAVTNRVDAVFTPTVNEWEGIRSIQLNVKALRPSQ
ncbi:MAG: single-stranded-DNA-specific exonuclease RecJ [Nitrospira sp.]|nr:single-stranded-DNA-specific exonuclease RecJ [Nitrospira sp.]